MMMFFWKDRSSDLQTLYQRATDATLSKKERASYHLALMETSTHLVDSPLYQLDYGSNDIGATLATAMDMMHAFELGILQHLLMVFTASMTMSVQVKMDKLVEKLFLPLHSTCRKDFLHYNFKGGAMSLTMLNLHYWPGMAFTFLVALLTEEGMAACHTCFSEEDAEEPNFPWEEAPPVDLANIYRPPILHQGTSTDLAGDDTSDVGSSLEGEYVSDVDDDDDGPVGITKDKGEAKKAKKSAVHLKCSYLQFVNLLEELLCFHAWYKEGLPPIVAATPKDEVNHLQTCIRRMLGWIQVCCPRNEGRGWKLQKFHEMLHLVIHLKEYCHASNFDHAGRDEQLLKDFFKDLAKNSQQRGQTVFTEQLAKCMFEKQLIQKALYSINGHDTEGEALDLDLPGRRSIVGVSLSFTMEHFCDKKRCPFWWLGSNESIQVHPTVLSFFGKQWETL